MTFKDILPGNMFLFCGACFIKLKEPYVKILNRTYKAVRIGAGDLVNFSDNDKVLTKDKQ